MSKYTDSDQNFKASDAFLPKVDDEDFRQKLLIFHICYDLTRAPKTPLWWLEVLYLTGEFSKDGPVKLYDRWIAKKVASSEEEIKPIMRSIQDQRQILVKWQESEDGLLLLDAKLIWDETVTEWYYVYEMPFLRLVEKVWGICPIGLETPRIKAIAKREFNRMYPDKESQPGGKGQKQTQRQKIRRAVSTLLSLLEDYNSQHGEKAGRIWFESDVDEILEDKGNPLIIKVPES